MEAVSKRVGNVAAKEGLFANAARSEQFIKGIGKLEQKEIGNVPKLLEKCLEKSKRQINPSF